MNFEVGKKVICVKSHKEAGLNTGDIFELQGIKKDPCKKCGGVLFDVGKSHQYKVGQRIFCGEHETEEYYCDGIWWFLPSRFAPYDDSLSSLTVEMILDEETILQP